MKDSAASAIGSISLRAYAKHRGVSLPAVQKAIRAGRITTTPAGKIDSARADADWERNTTPPTMRADSGSRPAARSLPPAAGVQHQAEPLLSGLSSFAA